MTNSENIQRIMNVSENFVQIIDDETYRKKIIDQLKPQLQRLSLGLFRVVVMGEVKKGKSSFISALLGEYGYLPIDSDVATSTVYKVMYGPEYRYTVFFLPDGQNSALKEPITIEKDQLAAYGTENGNPSNEKQVDFIGIEMPNYLLKKGLVIIDTPGVGGLFRRHRDITLKYVPRADAVFFVFDSVEALASQDEIEFLKEIYKHTKRVFYVQTKIDKVSEENWKEWKKRNLNILRNNLKLERDKILYFPVSSERKKTADNVLDEEKEERLQDLIDSKFRPLIRFLNTNLISRKESILSRNILDILKPEVAKKVLSLQMRIAITQQDNKEELKKIEESLKKSNEEAGRWEKEELQKEVRSFSDQISDLKRKTMKKIQEEFNPAGAKFGDFVRQNRARLRTPHQIKEEAETIIQDYAGRCLETGNEIVVDFQNEFIRIYSETIKNAKESLKSLSKKMGNYDPWSGVPMKDLHARRVDIDALRSAVLSSSMASGLLLGGLSLFGGGSIGHAIMSAGLLGLNPLGLAIAGGAAVAAVCGGLYGYRSVLTHKKEQAIIYLEEALKQTSLQALQKFTIIADEIFVELQRKARDSISEFFQGTEKAFSEKIAEVQQAMQQTHDEAERTKQKITAELESVVRLDTELNKIHNSLKQMVG